MRGEHRRPAGRGGRAVEQLEQPGAVSSAQLLVGPLLVTVAWLEGSAPSATSAAVASTLVDRTMGALRHYYAGVGARHPLDAFLAGWPGPIGVLDAAVRFHLVSAAVAAARSGGR